MIDSPSARWTRRLVLGALAALPGAANAAAPGDVLVMRFAMRGPRPLTTMTVGGKGPYLVLINSGNAVAFTLNQSIIDKLDLRMNGEGRIYGATGSDVTQSYLAHDVVVGQALREPDVAIVAAHDLKEFDGILPIYVMMARPTDLDFERGEIRLQMRGTVDRTGFRAVRTESEDTGGFSGRTHFVVRAAVNGVPARLLVDTGAPGFVSLAGGFVRQNRLWDKFPRRMDGYSGGVTGQRRRSRTVRTDTVAVGGLTFRDAVINLSDPSTPAVSDDVDGLLGIEFLRRFTVGFDAPAHTLWLKPNPALRDPWSYDRSGLTWRWDGGKAVVEAVAEGSPAAAAGLKVGDELVGFQSEKEALAWDRRLRGDPDTEIKLDIRRDGAVQPMKMVLDDWL